ncbi:septation protein IspZ [Sphingorhabdus sp.]|uniref:septation protein IspZ n=1 Tax=Sphingorhabdus sp. TaxID=1902408 RepID=UPI0039191B8A
MSFTWWRYPRRRFSVDGLSFAVASRARSDGLHSALSMLGAPQCTDQTPVFGPDSVRNHLLRTTLPDGRMLEVELGYMGLWTTGVVARVDGVVVYESHKGRVPAYPEKYQSAAVQNSSFGEIVKAEQGAQGINGGVFARRNRLPFAVDVGTGLLFYFVAKLTDLQTAAMLGIVVGFGLVIFQRITKIDVTGGLALFGILMLCISAALAVWLNDDEWIKLRGTITGIIAASFFIIDGARGGPYIGKGLARYMPYSDIDAGRFAIVMGVIGLIMAGLNYGAAKLLTTDNWLFYKTFVDNFIVIGLVFLALRFARTKPVA